MLRADSGSSVDAHEPEFDKAPTPPGLLQEHYRYPHLYRMPDPGKRYADIQLRRELSFSRWIEGSGDVARFLPGFVFSVSHYPRPEINNEHWWVTSVLQQGEQPQALQREAPDRGVQYHASFLAIPDTTRFVPGEAADFSEDLLCRTALLALALNRAEDRPSQPGTALVVSGNGPAPALPPLLAHVAICRPQDLFAARLMAARFKPAAALATPMHVRALPDPMLGLWLEVAPATGVAQADFSVGVLEAEITSFGVGPRGVIPARSRLDFPVLGIKGELGARAFCACAARNELSEATACYCRVGGIPRGVFLGPYLDEAQQSGEAVVLPFTAD